MALQIHTHRGVEIQFVDNQYWMTYEIGARSTWYNSKKLSEVQTYINILLETLVSEVKNGIIVAQPKAAI